LFYNECDMVYLDFNASTPVDGQVLKSMLPYFSGNFANPSSVQHGPGNIAASGIELARSQCSKAVGARSVEVIFTSGATEAINLGIRGILSSLQPRKRILVNPTEHKAVLEAVDLGATSSGMIVEEIPIHRDGRINHLAFAKMLGSDVALIAVMQANNETGVINDVKTLANMSHSCGAIFFSDLTQTVGKIEADFGALDLDLAAFSSHKIYGPKGAGALLVRKSLLKKLVPLIVGGGHENGYRSGTANVPAIVGFGEACKIAQRQLVDDAKKMSELIGQFLELVNSSKIGDVEINGMDAPRLPNTVNIRFVGADANAIMSAMPEVCVSSGSACQSAVPSPSHVLTAMSSDRVAASESIRFSFGRQTTESDVSFAVQKIFESVSYVRQVSGFFAEIA